MNVSDGDALQPFTVQAVNRRVLVSDEDVKVRAKLNFCCDNVENASTVLVILLIRPHERLVSFVLVGLKDFVDRRLFFLQRPKLDDTAAGMVRGDYQRVRVFLCHPLEAQHFQVNHVFCGGAFVDKETWKRLADNVQALLIGLLDLNSIALHDGIFLRCVHDRDVKLSILIGNVSECAKMTRLSETLRRLTHFLVVVDACRGVCVDGEGSDEPGRCYADAAEVRDAAELSHCWLEASSLILVGVKNLIALVVLIFRDFDSVVEELGADDVLAKINKIIRITTLPSLHFNYYLGKHTE